MSCLSRRPTLGLGVLLGVDSNGHQKRQYVLEDIEARYHNLLIILSLIVHPTRETFVFF
jgi:hypothetical protein